MYNLLVWVWGVGVRRGETVEMMLGKRGRPPPVKRTTSMTEFTLGGAASDPFNAAGWNHEATTTTHPHRRNSADFVQTPHFLTVCSLCHRRLIPGHDIYMYRGDSAFCSSECRQQQMTQDDNKDKCSSFPAAATTTTTAAAV